MTGETVSNTESQKDELHAAKFRNTKEQSIVIYSLKTDMTTVEKGLGERKDTATPLT